MKTDRASMAHSLEARVPFLDPVVTNLAFALPTRLKVRGLAKKVLLRKAVEPLAAARRSCTGRKRGFSIPAAAWLRGELEPFARATLSAETLRRQGFFQPEPVTRLIDEHVAGREDWSRQLWGLLAFTLWYERHVEQEPPHLSPAGWRRCSRERAIRRSGSGIRERSCAGSSSMRFSPGEKTATAGLARGIRGRGRRRCPSRATASCSRGSTRSRSRSSR